MYIKSISFSGFRNLTDRSLELNRGINIFHGSNAQGKTNILEAVFICATGRSQRTRSEDELIKFGERESHIRLSSNNGVGSDRIDVHIKYGSKKGMAVNGIPLKSYNELFGTVYIVMFSPEDLDLIKAGPSIRRRMMDFELCQLSPVYCHSLRQYYKILKQRNKLLKSASGGSKAGFRPPPELDSIDIWDSQLADYGKSIVTARRSFVTELGVYSAKKHSEITQTAEFLKLEYIPETDGAELYDKLKKNIKKDIFYGSTQNGPHKDDIAFIINGIDARKFGSQGQQRTAALSSKLAQAQLIAEKTGKSPVLLLDDVMSELDEARQKCLMEHVNEMQTLITCTGIEDSIRKYSDKSTVFEVSAGNVNKINKKQ